MKKETIECINKYIANLCIEYIKLHNLHWNVIGSNFKSIHEFLQEQYNNISESLDSIAELLRINNEFPYASLKTYLALADIEEISSKEYKQDDVIKIVLFDYESLKKQAEEIKLCADKNDEFDVVNQFEDELININKLIWFLKSMSK